MTHTLAHAYLPLADRPGRYDVVMDGDQIVSVTPSADVLPVGEDVTDLSGRTLLPGLIDTHIHLLNQGELAELTDYGVTTAVELGTHPDSLIQELRRAQGASSFLSAGSAASAPGSTQIVHMGFPEEAAVTGPEDAERFIAWRAENGADLIKIIIEDPHGPTPALLPETLKALVDAAHARGLRTVAHVVTAYSFELGLDAGVDVLTHAPLDRPLPGETVQRMVQNGTVVSPTLVMMRVVAESRAGQPGPVLDFEHALESVRRLHAAGVRIIAGTDANNHPFSPAPVPQGSSLHTELELLVQAGLSPLEALHAATDGAARGMGLGDRGRIEAGQRADFVVLHEDPSEDISRTRGIGGVVVAGRHLR